jgi:hypothetical protein
MLVSHAIGIVSGAVTSSAEDRVPGRRRVHAGASFSALSLRLQLEKATFRAGSLCQKLRETSEQEAQHQRQLKTTVVSSQLEPNPPYKITTQPKQAETNQAQKDNLI